MSETKNLKLFKHEEPLETNNNKFDIDKALNKNWDKVDDYAGEANSKIDLITEIIDLLPKVSNEGESIALENTARAKFTKFRIGGNSSQETRSGKNKIIFDDIKETVNQGITCSIKNGVITLNGTASGVVNFYSDPINISAGKYTLSKNMEGTWSLGTATSSLAILLQQKEKDDSYTTVKGGELTAYSSAKNFTTLDLAEGTYRIRIFIAIGNILNNFTWRPQLEEGENFTGFEQGGLMPSVEFPSEIKNVKESVRINIQNKNLCGSLSQGYDNKGTITNNNQFVCTTDLINVKSNTQYIISNNLNLPIASISYYKDEKFVRFQANIGSFTITIPEGINQVRINIYREHTLSISDFTYIQFEEGKKAKPYLLHEQQAVTFPFTEGQKLMQGDYLADDGIHHTKTQIQLDGITNGLKVSNVTKHSNNIYYCVINLVKQSINNTNDINGMYCSHFMPHFEVRPGSCYIAGYGFYLVLVLTDQTITTADAANTWLAAQKEKGTPVVIEYELAQEEVETYTEEQKEAYEQIKNAISYKGQTNIFSTNEIKPIFKVEALADIGLLLNNMQAQILAGGE